MKLIKTQHKCIKSTTCHSRKFKCILFLVGDLQILPQYLISCQRVHFDMNHHMSLHAFFKNILALIYSFFFKCLSQIHSTPMSAFHLILHTIFQETGRLGKTPFVRRALMRPMGPIALVVIFPKLLYQRWIQFLASHYSIMEGDGRHSCIPFFVSCKGYSTTQPLVEDK